MSEIWTAVEPDIKKDDYKYKVIKISDGLKIQMKQRELDNLLLETEFLKVYQLNIKRLNRWWYSVCFKKKEIM